VRFRIPASHKTHKLGLASSMGWAVHKIAQKWVKGASCLTVEPRHGCAKIPPAALAHPGACDGVFLDPDRVPSDATKAGVDQ
jgi:hypothetical protein